MNQERADQILQRRQSVAENFELDGNTTQKVLTKSVPSLEQQQIAIIDLKSKKVLEQLAETRSRLKVAGYKGEPSETRLRAEFTSSLGVAWLNFADQAYDTGDFLTYVVFADLAAGVSSVAGAIIGADDLNNQQSSPIETPEGAIVSQAITQISGNLDTATSAAFYMRANKLIQDYASLLEKDPTGIETARFALEYLSTPKEVDQFPIPNITDFVVAGAQIAIKVMQELEKLQDSRESKYSI